MVCLAMELVGPWVVLGFSVGMEAFDELLLINVPWGQEFSGVFKFWIQVSCLWLSVLFLRLLHPYSPDDKTSRLVVKQFSTSRDTQRGSQSYMEKGRGRREIEVTRRRGLGVKRGRPI